MDQRAFADVREGDRVMFILAATGALLLASNVHGGEHLRDLLAWAQPSRLIWVGIAYAAILALSGGAGARLDAPVSMCCSPSPSRCRCRWSGSILFATLIVPPLIHGA